MLILYLLAPVLVLLGNFINTPIESVIKRYYINDAKKILRFSNELIIIGVTGSYGKTSLKYYLNTILKAKYNVLMTPESYNTPMGVVKTIRNSLNATHQIFICEMGAKKVGEIKEICDIVHPKHGIITAIGPQHLETFKSLENIQKTKFELADALPSDGLLFLNIDDKNITSHKSERPFVSYGVQGHGEYAVSNLKLSNIGTTFTVKKLNGEVCDFSTKLIGSHNVLNIVGAIAIANQLGIELSQIRTQVKKIEGVPHRLQLINKGKDLIIDDAFNSNPNGAAAALETLNLFDGFKILITPGMVELGSKQAEYNYSFGKNAATVCDYVVIVGTTNKDSILNGLEDSGFLQQKIYLAKTIQNALNQINLVQSNGQNKIILLENDLPDNF